jgi:predicted transcriptional regulator
MNAFAESTYPKELPDDLKVLLQKQKVPENDPLIAVLAWHYLRTNESRDVIQNNAAQLKTTLDECREAIQNDRLKLEAALDKRLKEMLEWTDALKFLNGHLEKLSEVLEEKPLGISKQITDELAHPIADSVKSVKQLTVHVGSLVHDVDKSRKRLRRSHLITAFLTGYSTGILLFSWIYFHIFLH